MVVVRAISVVVQLVLVVAVDVVVRVVLVASHDRWLRRSIPYLYYDPLVISGGGYGQR